MLVWDEADFVACLETLPVFSEDDLSYWFSVAKDGLTLQLTVFEFEGDIAVTLHRDGVEGPVFDVTLIDCMGARYINDKGGEWLEFSPCKTAGTRYDGTSPLPFGLSVSVTPSIQLRMFSRAL